jgi:hypothetical protein
MLGEAGLEFRKREALAVEFDYPVEAAQQTEAAVAVEGGFVVGAVPVVVAEMRRAYA